MDERERITEELIKQLVKMGYPAEFGAAIANNLRTEKTMSRMIRYLRNANPRSAEEIADEMLACWRSWKTAIAGCRRRKPSTTMPSTMRCSTTVWA